MKKLDFIIVGAQKCATTTIHKYLEEHPAVDLPLDKEAPFFNGSEFHAECIEQGDSVEESYARFLAQNYLQTGASESNSWGKASPQYMSNPEIPARIKAVNPDAKIIAVLRNPVKRAFSHYRMAVRRGTESRTFEQAVIDSLDMDKIKRGREGFAPSHARGYESEADFYLAWGEYGRILEHYLHEFGRDNLLVLFTEDLQAKPGQVLDKLLAFIGLDTGWRPESLGKQFHQGGGKPWISPNLFRQAANAPFIKNLYGLVSENQKKKLRYWVDQLNVRKTPAVYGLPPVTLSRLNQIYSEDAKRLSELGFPPPWANQFSSERLQVAN